MNIKKQTIGLLGLVLASTVASTFAMEVMVKTGPMMKDDNMMKKDEMMVKDTMMMKSETSMNMNLMMGSRGMDVTALQTFLEEKGFLNIPQGVAKGYFGKATKMGLMKYQASEGVSSTGYFGPMTRAKINMGMMKKDSMMKDDGMMKKDAMMGDKIMEKDGVMVGGAMMISSRDIVDNAVLANNVTTVVAAVKAAGLVDTLKGKGPFTVFAPNNTAFNALPSGTVASLLLPENKAKLADILTYHVVAGAYKVKDLMDGQMLTTVEGKMLKITKIDGRVMINGTAMIETADVISSNGVTHVINSVLLPQ